MEQFRVEWFTRQGATVGDMSNRPEGYFLTAEASTTADALCMYAMMLHEMLVIRGRPLADLAARTEAVYSEIQEIFAATNFEGVQGTVRYAPNSPDPKGSVILQQMQD